jgi:SAM-dependent methyltransferase
VRYGDFDAIERERYRLEPHIPSFARFAEAKDLDVLEIGVGAGTDFLQWRRHGARAVGIDLTQAGTRLTHERLRREGFSPTIAQADGEALPFSDRMFDVVYSYGVLHHSPDTYAAIQEIHRVLKPGGVARIMLYHVPSITGWLLWLRYCALRSPWRSPRWAIYHYLESPGTKAFTIPEARRMFSAFSSVVATSGLAIGDLLAHAPSRKHQDAFSQIVWRWYPRRMIRALPGIDSVGLFLFIEATR